MQVTILRHGEAGDAPRDRDRTLTGRGRREVSRGAQQFLHSCQALGVALPTAVYTSPWLRTCETTDIALQALGHSTPRHELTALQPGGDVAGVEVALAGTANADRPETHVLLVSHQPLVTYLVRHWVSGGEVVPPLSPGGLVSFSLPVVAADCGELTFWMLPPLYEPQR